jgi:hypothetical protein
VYWISENEFSLIQQQHAAALVSGSHQNQVFRLIKDLRALKAAVAKPHAKHNGMKTLSLWLLPCSSELIYRIDKNSDINKKLTKKLGKYFFF